MKKKYDFCLSVTLLLMAFLLAMSGIRRRDEALASRIAPEILRFHVLANSNTPEDQALKLEIKDLLLENIQNGLADSLSGTGSSAHGLSREIVCQYITAHKAQLEYAAEACMAQKGFPYKANILLESCEFPEKTYGDMTFPAGTYDAVRVVLGDGAGENFWCVLYPSLCYLDSTHAVVPDSSKELLETLIPEDDFQALLSARRLSLRQLLFQDSQEIKTEQESLLPHIKIRFKLADLL